MQVRIIYITLALALVISGCTKRPSLYEMDQADAFSYLQEKYDKGDYVSAVEGLDFYTLNYSGSAQIDSAQFLLGMGHFKLKEYLIASSAFDELSRRFPRSPLVSESMFMVGLCYWELSPKYSLDQEFTYNCIEALQTFIDYFPHESDKVAESQEYIGKCREKLAHKEYASGIIYLKMKDYRAAAIYFRKIMEQFYDTEWAAPASFQLSKALSGQGLAIDAMESYKTYLEKYPEHEWRSKAESALSELRDSEAG